MTPEQERLYDELDAQGGLSPDKIRAELGIVEATPVPTVDNSSSHETDATVAKLERGSHYGPHRHFAPSDRDVEPWSTPPLLNTLPKPEEGEQPLWHSTGRLAATAAFQTAKKTHQQAEAG